MRNIILIFLLLSCNTKTQPKESLPNPDLESKSISYLEKITDDWIFENECDSLLFSSLLNSARIKAGFKKFNIKEARDEQGKWYRRPGKDCGPAFGNSRSIISRDMMLGVFWYLWTSKDLQTAKELLNYLKTNSYFLGTVPDEGSPGELFMLPSYMNTLAELVAKLEGTSCNYTECFFVNTYSSNITGFERHLQVWHILLRGEIKGSLTDKEIEILKKHKKEQPLNPLFSAAYHKYSDGNFEEVSTLFNDYDINNLPTSTNHCSDWPVQREYGKDWLPCPEENKQHLGAELPVIYYLIMHK